MQRPHLTEGGVKSFIAHVAGVAAGAVVGLAATVLFAGLAPHVAAVVALGGLAAAGTYIGAKLGDTYFHWARGEEAGGGRFVSRTRRHFDGLAA